MQCASQSTDHLVHHAVLQGLRRACSSATPCCRPCSSSVSECTCERLPAASRAASRHCCRSVDSSSTPCATWWSSIASCCCSSCGTSCAWSGDARGLYAAIAPLPWRSGDSPVRGEPGSGCSVLPRCVRDGEVAMAARAPSLGTRCGLMCVSGSPSPRMRFMSWSLRAVPAGTA
jgi:hypothetical protein